jgi:7-carboxy-7-deazaguanine synthase
VVEQPTLVVSEVFGPTVQGEGPTMGHRAAFVRLGRCNLDCTWCDTPYTWDWERYDPKVELHERSIADVVAEVDAMGVDRVVVTGGEPLLQQRRLLPFLVAASERGWTVEVETNGTLAPTEETVRLVGSFNVSPKLANSGVTPDRAIVPKALRALAALGAEGRAAFKFVVSDPDDLDEVQAIVDAHGLAPVWIMPEGRTAEAVLEGGRRLADLAVARGWHLTTRLHVVLWGDERGR